MHKLSFELHQQEAASSPVVRPWLALFSFIFFSGLALILGLTLVNTWLQA